MNCRKMYDFFTKPPSTNRRFDDFRAREFTKTDLTYTFATWTPDIQLHMDKQLMHISRDRITRTRVWEGYTENPLFLAEFKGAWKLFFDDLQDAFKDEFREEIASKVASADFLGLVLYAG